MSTPTLQIPTFPTVSDIMPAIIRDKKRRPRIVDIAPSAQPFLPDRTQLLPNVPTWISFESLVREIDLQNNSGNTLYYTYYGNISTVSFQILTGATWIDTVRVDGIWLLSVAGTFVNPFQSDGNGIVLVGKL